jgi:cysteinyl-tRNA synthetase
VELTLYNTLSRTKEAFRPRRPEGVGMFVCGPTVYDLAHVGHAKTCTNFDLVVRYLRHHGHRVTYAQNITDVDDKIIARAAGEGVQPQALADRYRHAFIEDMRALHNTGVDVYAPAHDHIEQMVLQIGRLIEAGHAYRLSDGWYYDLSTFPDYGKLSRRSHVRPGDSVARIDENPGKRNTGDFALWKFRRRGEPYWPTELGEGRPGWHIEDTAITEHLFGPQYDLHGGAVDLVFPHHEAEIAQMEGASGKVPVVRYWMHAGLLTVGPVKMAKSGGNALTIRDALAMADYRTLRYAFISQHYRSSIELTAATLDEARAARRRVESFARSLGTADGGADARLAETRREFFARLDDDLDTPGALAVLFRFIREQNKAGHGGPAVRRFLAEVDGLFDSFRLQADTAPTAGVEEAVRTREGLRRDGRYAEADRIRDALSRRGIAVEDTSEGTTWWYREVPP